MADKESETAAKVFEDLFYPSNIKHLNCHSAGDSGNPLMNYVTSRGRTMAVQFGIVTAGHSECGRGALNFPGIYTSVDYYLEWILDNLEE